MADLSGVEAKVKWAEKHIDNLQRAIGHFWQTNPYEVIVQDDPNNSERREMVLRVHREIPPCIPLITGDAAHNLRTALDHLACVAVAINGTVTNETAFPVWRRSRAPTAIEYKALVLGKVKGAPTTFIDLMLTLQPYQGGNHEGLWVLDYLDARDKHRLLLEALASHPRLVLDFGGMFPPEVAKRFPPGALRTGLIPEDRFPLEDGFVFFNAPPEDIEKMNPQVAIEIALGEPAVLRGKAVVPELTQLVQFTRGVIDHLGAVL